MTAFVYREYTLLCDRPGCPAQFGPFQGNGDLSRAGLRKQAAKSGWAHVHREGYPRKDDKDFCPSHNLMGIVLP